MIDRQTVCRRLHALESYAVELERLAATLSRDAFDQQISSQWMVEHGLQLAIECVLDIGSHIVAAEQLGTPQSYREVIDLLGQRGVVPAAFVQHNLGMPGFRASLLQSCKNFLAQCLSCSDVFGSWRSSSWFLRSASSH